MAFDLLLNNHQLGQMFGIEGIQFVNEPFEYYLNDSVNQLEQMDEIAKNISI